MKRWLHAWSSVDVAIGLGKAGALSLIKKRYNRLQLLEDNYLS